MEAIYLESDEEITSIIDKLKVVSGKSIGLVVPKGATILQSVVNLRILKKEAEKLGIDLSIVTQDRVGRNLASQGGLSVYDNVKADKPLIQAARPIPKTEDVIEVDMSRDKSRLPSDVHIRHYDQGQAIAPKDKVSFYSRPVSAQRPVRHRKLAWPKIFIPTLAITLLLLGFLYFFLPRAIAQVTLKAENFEKAIEVVLDVAVQSSGSGVVKGELVEATQEVVKEGKATGKKEVGEKAKGTVKLYNEWDSNAQPTASGSSLVHVASGKVFKTTADVTIPGASVTLSQGQLVTTPGTVSVTVEAAEPGDSYNVDVGKFNISGLSSVKQVKIYGESSAKMSGGTSRQITILAQSDIDSLKNEITTGLFEQNKKELTDKAAKSRLVEAAIENNVTKTDSSVAVGAEAEKFNLNIGVRSRVIVFKDKEYQEVILQELGKFVPAGKEMVLKDGDAIETRFKSSQYDEGKMILEAVTKTRLATKIDEGQLKKTLSGQSVEQGKLSLQKLDGVENVEVKLWPSWWLKKIPNRINQIKIEKDYK